MTSAATARPPARAAAVHRRRAASRWEVAAVALAMVAVAAIGLVTIARDAPLLWDEAVYSLRMRDVVGDEVRSGYWLEVRAPGLPLLLTPVGLLFEIAEVPLRTTTLLMAVAGLALTWLIARATIGPVPAVVAVWLLAIAPGWNESSWQVMPDIPGATLALGAVAVVLWAARGDRLSWWALAAAPLAGAATLVRYGAPLLLGPAVLAAFLLQWETVRSSWRRSLVILASTAAAAAVVWFVPVVTGASRPPVFVYAARQDRKAVPAATSAADFASTLLELVGPVLGPLILVGSLVAVVLAVRGRAPRGPVAAFALIALSVLLLMLFGIAAYELRYLTPALPFLAMLAAVGLVKAARWVTPRSAATLGAVVAVLGLGVAADTAVDRAGEITRDFGPVRVAYRDIASVTAPPCVVLDNNPTAEWHTGCAALDPSPLWRLVQREIPYAAAAPDEPVHAIVRDRAVAGGLVGDERALVEALARRDVSSAPTVAALDVGTVERVVAELRARGLTDGG